MFITIVHQTLQDRENADYVENNGPFAVENIEQSYLGAGYYFWDDHIELAHWWGTNRIKSDYVICEGKLEVKKELFLDLVGSRQDQKYFKAIIEKLGALAKNMAIGKIIEFLKNLETQPNKKGIFPFKVIRAMDVANNSFNQQYKHFAEGRNGKSSITPQMIICLIEKNKLVLPTYKIIYPDKYL